MFSKAAVIQVAKFCTHQKKMPIKKRKWLFCYQWCFTLKGYFAITIHVSLNSHICYDSGGDACGVMDSGAAFKYDGYGFKSSLAGFLNK